MTRIALRHRELPFASADVVDLASDRTHRTVEPVMDIERVPIHQLLERTPYPEAGDNLRRFRMTLRVSPLGARGDARDQPLEIRGRRPVAWILLLDEGETMCPRTR